MNYKKTIAIAINFLSTFIIFLVFSQARPYQYSNILKFFVLFLSVSVSIASFILLKSGKIKLFKGLFLINIGAMLFLFAYHILYTKNMLYVFSSVQNFKNFILSTGTMGILIYIFIQMGQIIFLPIPASIIAVAGAVIYGPLLGAIYCTVGVLLGSYLSFFIGRTLGYRLVCWVVGRENAEKYANLLNNNGKVFLGLAFLLPMFPDDILCLISGITSMKFRYFFVITTIFRPIGVFCMCFFGSGSVIPFSGWGIPLWIVIAIVMAICVILTYKYQSKMEEWVIKKLVRRKRKSQN